MKRNLFFVALFGLLFSSCSTEDFKQEGNSQTQSGSKYHEDTQMKIKFAKALANAVNENQTLREFIKQEALKQITKDYDVIYHLIKDVDINSNSYLRTTSTSSLTLHNLLLPYFENEAELIEIENKLPLLTIFVPDLQEESFSAENWNTATQIPMVAVRSYESDDVMCYGINEELLILAEYMPDFPVIVVKDNERLISDQTYSQFDALDTRVITNEASSDIQLRFTDNNFDSTITYTNPTAVTSTYPRVDQIHQDAYNVFSNYTPGGWQRDYIYYGLTPTITEGGINPTYKEQLTSFKLTGSPQGAYTHIASSQDPRLRPLVIGNRSAWTDGSFDIGIILNYGAKNSNMGLETTRGFPVKPSDLFEIAYVPAYSGWLGRLIKRPVISALKMYDLYNNPTNRIEFPVWDLNSYSNQWKIKFEEVDVTTTYTQTVSASNKFNMNFSLEPSTGILKKIGLKLGASNEQIQTNTFVTTYTDVSDNLQNSEINFYDNVVDYNGSILVPRKNYTGRVEFEFRPRRVY